MSAALAGPFLEWRREDDLGPAVALAVAVHVVLAVALVLGVSWQSRAPDVVTVELWQPPPPPAAVVQPEPAPVPQAKPEPRIEKPDIAIKADYIWQRNRSAFIDAPRSFNIGLGWWF